MSVKYKDVLKTAQTVRDVANALIELIIVRERSGIENRFIGTIPFTHDQKQVLETKYLDLIIKLKNEVNKL